MSWLGSGENIWLITSLCLDCPPLTTGGLLAERASVLCPVTPTNHH